MHFDREIPHNRSFHFARVGTLVQSFGFHASVGMECVWWMFISCWFALNSVSFCSSFYSFVHVWKSWCVREKVGAKVRIASRDLRDRMCLSCVWFLCTPALVQSVLLSVYILASVCIFRSVYPGPRLFFFLCMVSIFLCFIRCRSLCNGLYMLMF